MKFFKVIPLFILMSCFVGEELPPDQQTWEYGQPSSVGLSEETLLFSDASIFSGTYDRVSGLVIIKDDKLVFENYYDTVSRHSLVPLNGASIVFTVVGIGIAADQGLLSLSDPIFEYLPEYSEVFNANDLKQQITIEHLLTHQAGFSWNESILPAFQNPENNINQMRSSDDWIQFILERPLEAIPGQRYNFNSGTGSILSKIIEEASGQSFESFLRTNLLNFIQVSAIEFSRDPSGNFDGGSGVSISMLDWTKLAYLIMNEGIQDGRRIIDPNFIAESTSVQSSVSPTFNLGYGWRLFGDSFASSFPFDKDDAFYITGELGQHQYIIPSRNMIVSIYAENFFGSNNLSLNLFFQIIGAIQ